ncbi:hypothetical protein A3733_37105 [Pseudoalteromonas shioyasakiensis]|nr:hypothetical protein A3733_37105 [Pseudoalteromonas shioyasakiensis]
MTTNYILDISKEEYRDDYADGANGELWQIYAKQQLISDLESILTDARIQIISAPLMVKR